MACPRKPALQRGAYSGNCAGGLRRSYAVPVRDSGGRAWDLVIKSWANGTEHRRVYVLEQAALFLRAHSLREGDALGLCTDATGALAILVPAACCLLSAAPSPDS